MELLELDWYLQHYILYKRIKLKRLKASFFIKHFKKVLYLIWQVFQFFFVTKMGVGDMWKERHTRTKIKKRPFSLFFYFFYFPNSSLIVLKSMRNTFLTNLVFIEIKFSFNSIKIVNYNLLPSIKRLTFPSFYYYFLNSNKAITCKKYN